MALIECPDCRRTVSDKAVTCLKCGRPIATTVEPLNTPGVPVQMIEKTSKKLKGQMMGFAGAFALSILVMMVAGGAESTFLAVIGTLMFLLSVGWLVVV